MTNDLARRQINHRFHAIGDGRTTAAMAQWLERFLSWSSAAKGRHDFALQEIARTIWTISRALPDNGLVLEDLVGLLPDIDIALSVLTECLTHRCTRAHFLAELRNWLEPVHPDDPDPLRTITMLTVAMRALLGGWVRVP